MKNLCLAALTLFLAACAHTPADPTLPNTATLHVMSSAGEGSESNAYALFPTADCSGKADTVAIFAADTKREAYREVSGDQAIYIRAMFLQDSSSAEHSKPGAAAAKKYCINVTSFTPAKGHIYDISQNFFFDRCKAYVVDHDPAQSPPSLVRHDVKDSCIPPKTHREKDVGLF